MPALLKQVATRKADKPCICVEDISGPAPELGEPVPPSKPVEEWKTWTFAEYYADIRSVAKAFIALGIERFDAVSIFGFNSPEWFLSQLGAIVCGGMSAGIYPTDTPAQVHYKALHSGTAVAVCESEDKAQIFLDMQKDLPKLKAVIVWGTDKSIDKKVGKVQYLSWSNLHKVLQDRVCMLNTIDRKS